MYTFDVKCILVIKIYTVMSDIRQDITNTNQIINWKKVNNNDLNEPSSESATPVWITTYFWFVTEMSYYDTTTTTTTTTTIAFFCYLKVDTNGTKYDRSDCVHTILLNGITTHWFRSTSLIFTPWYLSRLSRQLRHGPLDPHTLSSAWSYIKILKVN